MNEANCVPFLCKQQIHSLSEWRRAALNKKKELQNAGINAYEAHPEYQKITKCKPDDSVFPSMSYCNRASPSKKSNTGKKHVVQKAPGLIREHKIVNQKIIVHLQLDAHLLQVNEQILEKEHVVQKALGLIREHKIVNQNKN